MSVFLRLWNRALLFGKPFGVSTFLFYTLFIESLCFELFNLSLATTNYGVNACLMWLTMWHHLIMMANKQGIQALLVDIIWKILCVTVSFMKVWDRGWGHNIILYGIIWHNLVCFVLIVLLLLLLFCFCTF